jgi:EthD domain
VPLLVMMPGLRRLVLNWALPDPNLPEPAYDMVGEDWFDDAQAMGAAFASAEGQRLSRTHRTSSTWTALCSWSPRRRTFPLPT